MRKFLILTVVLLFPMLAVAEVAGTDLEKRVSNLEKDFGAMKTYLTQSLKPTDSLNSEFDGEKCFLWNRILQKRIGDPDWTKDAKNHCRTAASMARQGLTCVHFRVNFEQGIYYLTGVNKGNFEQWFSTGSDFDTCMKKLQSLPE